MNSIGAIIADNTIGLVKGPKCSPALAAYRLSECRKNSCGQYDTKGILGLGEQCKACKCFVESKTTYLKEQCPEKRW